MYNFLISVVGLVAMGAIVIGGARYLTSVGNPSAIEDAKHTIYSAIYGLLLALASWVIISTINPDILVLQNPAMPWTAAGYSAGTEDPNAMCAGPGNLGNGTTAAPCHCVDDPNRPVTFTATPPPPGPYVVSTSIAPCSSNVLANPSPISITFNEPVILAPGAIGFSGITPFTQSWTDNVLTSGNTITLTLTNPFISMAYFLYVKATLIKDASGTLMASDYKYEFIVGRDINCALDTCPCVIPLPAAIDCRVACSDNYTPFRAGFESGGVSLHCGGLKSGKCSKSTRKKRDSEIRRGSIF